jgi:3-hydroxyisobutyrate dehydrogenase
MADPVVGFVGVGAMGGPMAARIAAAGHRVVAHDTDAARSAALAERPGVSAAATPDD